MVTLWAVCSAAAAHGERLSLQQAISEALGSPLAQAASAQTSEVAAQKKQAALRPNPRLYLQSEDWRPWADNFSFENQTEEYGYLGQTFETDGKRGKRVQVAEANLARARSDEQTARLQIAFRVASAYWNAVMLGRIAELLQGDMGAVDEVVEYDKERVSAGAMRGVDLLRMQMERNRLELALSGARRDAGQARLELWREMGQPPRMDAELADALEAPPALTPVPIATVLGQRADLQASRQAIEAAEADVRLQQALRVPDIDLLGGYKRNTGNNTGFGSLQVNLPFGNRNQGEIARAQASVNYAQQNLSTLELQVSAEVAENERAYSVANDMATRVIPEMLAEARENLRLMNEAYRIGGVDLLRYLDAERAEVDAEVNSLHTYGELQQAAVRLRVSYGEQP